MRSNQPFVGFGAVFGEGQPTAATAAGPAVVSGEGTRRPRRPRQPRHPPQPQRVTHTPIFTADCNTSKLHCKGNLTLSYLCYFSSYFRHWNTKNSSYELVMMLDISLGLPYWETEEKQTFSCRVIYKKMDSSASSMGFILKLRVGELIYNLLLLANYEHVRVESPFFILLSFYTLLLYKINV